MLTDEQIGVIAIEHGMGGYFRKSMSASDLVSFARAVERALQPQWSDQPPTEPGWYWFKSPQQSFDDPVWVGNGEVDTTNGYTYPIDRYCGQWAGPITSPEE